MHHSKLFPFNSSLILFLCTSLLLTACGNQATAPKSATQSVATSASPADTAIPTVAQTQDTNLNQSPPEKTSMWVTLAGMRCH